MRDDTATLRHGHPTPEESTMTTHLPFDGLTVVVTGEVPGMDRRQAQDAVTALGGKPSGSVSAKTSLVVVGDGAGVSKMAKVRQHGVPVVTAEVFAGWAGDPASWDGTPVGTPVEEMFEPEPPREPLVLSDHLLAQCVVYPCGVREVRMLCSCGESWLAETVHLAQNGPCPKAVRAA